jgi:hypothetical protein
MAHLEFNVASSVPCEHGVGGDFGNYFAAAYYVSSRGQLAHRQVDLGREYPFANDPVGLIHAAQECISLELNKLVSMERMLAVASMRACWADQHVDAAESDWPEPSFRVERIGAFVIGSETNVVPREQLRIFPPRGIPGIGAIEVVQGSNRPRYRSMALLPATADEVEAYPISQLLRRWYSGHPTKDPYVALHGDATLGYVEQLVAPDSLR